ncbi:hypothetical protein ONV78_13225 [Hahella sp. CR1]|uniref:hypothetical protein n=1 Tax=Hahella sp. CR1 TaxID=2992807 RepID=UPI0024436D40|nr:hypothetical protein [Hahella sp. CR1]MDG9668698.1 hypothetical protein [Hahella sp. CR1]
MTDSRQDFICDILRTFANEHKKGGIRDLSMITLRALEQVTDNEEDMLQVLMAVICATDCLDESEAIADLAFASLMVVMNAVTDRCPSPDRLTEMCVWIDGQLLLALEADIDTVRLRRIIQCATYARLEISEDVIFRINEKEVEDSPPFIGVPTSESMARAILELVAMNACKTEWDLLQVLTHLGAQMPEGATAFYVPALLSLETPWRDCAALLTMDPVRKNRQCAIEAWLLPECQALANETDLARLVAARKWLPEEDRELIDIVVKGLQRLRVGGAVAPSTKAEILGAYVSPFDSQGAFYAVLALRHEDAWKIWSARLQQGVGVTRGGLLIFPDFESLEHHIEGGKHHFHLGELALLTLQKIVRHFLLKNRDSGTLPTPELLWLISHVEGEWALPDAMNMDDLIEALTDAGELPADQWDFAQDMRRLTQPWLRSEWTGQHTTSEALILECLEPQRESWLERCALLACFLHERKGSRKEIELLRLAAASIASGKPLINISLIREMAESAFHWEGAPVQWLDMPSEMARTIRQKIY